MCLDVNLKGIWIVTRALIDHFKANQYGKIINISSIAGRQGSERMPAYGASKAGVISLTQSLASELGSANINVNTICPGLIWTDMWRHLEGIYTGAKTPEEVERRERFEKRSPNLALSVVSRPPRISAWRPPSSPPTAPVTSLVRPSISTADLS